MNYEILADEPDQLSENELDGFVSLASAGGEVELRRLKERVLNAKWLIRLRLSGDLAGVGALKVPNTAYRKKADSKARICLPCSVYPLALGWLHVRDEFRRMGYATKITKKSISTANGSGIFTTTRTNNDGVRRVLETLQFVAAGHPFPSDRRNHALQLFLRQTS